MLNKYYNKYNFYFAIIVIIILLSTNTSAFNYYKNLDSNFENDKILLFEDFEGGIIPPNNWSINKSNFNFSWSLGIFNTNNGLYSAECTNDSLNISQDEWLISPSLDLRGYSKISLSFNWSMSYFWGIFPNDNYDFNVKISTDNSMSWDLEWNENRAGKFEDWIWYNTTKGKPIDLTKYKENSNVLIAFQYIGTGGAQLNIDDIFLIGTVIDDPPLVEIICPNEAFAGDEIQFFSNVSGGKKPYLYNWNFGDGVKKYKINPIIIYERVGEYKVYLNVTDIAQNKGFAETFIKIINKSKKPQLVINNVTAEYKIDAIISNLGNKNAINVTWNIIISNKLKTFQNLTNGKFSCINCSCSTSIQSKTYNIFGFVKVDIFVWAENAMRVDKKGFGYIANGYWLFLLTI